VKGERLSKSQTRTLQAEAEKHLTDQQRNLLAKARLDYGQAEKQRRDAEATVVRVGTGGGLIAKEEANRVLMAAKEVSRKAEVALAVAEQTMGLRDSGTLCPPDIRQSPQGGPLPGQTPVPVRKSFASEDPSLARLTGAQRKHLAQLQGDVGEKLGALLKAERSHVREVAGGDRGRIQQSKRRLAAADDAHRAAVVNHTVALKTFGLSD
jgi:hypothetical protein